jgi:predicted DNA-binding transcriptional regulator AlpA
MSRLLGAEGRPAPLETPSVLVSAQTLAKRLSVSVRTLWRLRSAGKLPQPVRVGGGIRWRSAEIDTWIGAGCPEAKAWEAQSRDSEASR